MSEQAVVKREAPAAVSLRPETYPELLRIAETLAKSGLVPKALYAKPQDVAVILMTGHELGLAPMQAIRGIHVIEGKASMSADLIVGLVKGSPACEYFCVVSSSDKEAVYATLRRGDPEPTKLAYTLAQATVAGLASRDTWKRHPAAMLRARCAAALARAVYPDITMGIYLPDEAEEFARPVRSAGPLTVQAPVEPIDPEIPAEVQVETAPPPPDPEDAIPYADGAVAKIDERPGKKAPFWAVVLDTGEEFLTFDTAVKDEAADAFDQKRRVRIIYEKTIKGNLKVVELFPAPQEVTA